MTSSPWNSEGAQVSRYKPARAGIINLWDYTDEEFVFADGRLALRGHNGSGKTKALEVLFPFLLDGSLSARRIDPFSGQDRTMKSNLLYRGQDAAYGYVWMEFARDSDVVTLIVGLSAHKHREQVTASYYVTTKRLGVDFGLLAADSRPLTANQLAAVLGPGACSKDRRDYREAVDAKLFGLGTDRYALLLDLLLSLRRPLLAKDLDPVKVSDTLSAGLSPIDEDLIEQAARDFDNLAAVQRRCDDLTAATQAVNAFLAQYTAYIRANAKWQLGQFAGLVDEASRLAGLVDAAVREVRRAAEAEASAEAERDKSRARISVLDAKREVLANSKAFADHALLAQQRKTVEEAVRRLGGDRDRLRKDRRTIDGLTRDADDLRERIGKLLRANERDWNELLTAARVAGLEISSAKDPMQALVAGRLDDIRQVRNELDRVEEADRLRGVADELLGKARGKAENRAKNAGDALRRLDDARGELIAALAGWLLRWHQSGIVTDGFREALTAAAEQCGYAAQPGLDRVFARMIAGTRDALIATREKHSRGLSEFDEKIAALIAERDAIAEERDEAPPASDLRPADRSGRPGAPLWQLARFAEHVPPEQAAAIEGALYASGTLTAWVYPQAGQTTAALAAAEADGYLVPLPEASRPASCTLADFLEPEEQDLVPVEVIRGVLRSIMVADAPPDSDARAWITTAAQYGHGVQAGALPKRTPEYIGATNRAARRRARLADLDARLKEFAGRRTALQTELDAVLAKITDIDLAGRELPATTAVAEAATALATASALQRDAEAELADAEKALDKAIAELSTCQRNLRQVAGGRNMPQTRAEVNTVDSAVGDVTRLAEQLASRREEDMRMNEDLCARNIRIGDLEDSYSSDANALAELEVGTEAQQSALAEAEASVGRDYTEAVKAIKALDTELAGERRTRDNAETRRSAEHDKRTGGARDLDNHRSGLRTSLENLRTGADAFAPFAHPDLRDLLGVTSSAHWPAAERWPSGTGSAERIEALLAERTVTGDPVAAVDAVMPAEAQGLLAAYREATAGGRAVVQATLDTAGERVTDAYQDFERVLRGLEDGYEVNLVIGTPAMVDVTAEDGRLPVAAFARRVAEEAHTQGILLEERERTVLEDTLLSSLAHQIHQRVLAARDLVRDMDADTRAKPMSSGLSIGISWIRNDRNTEFQHAVASLLQRDVPALSAGDLEQLRRRLREMIREHRARNPRDTFRETLRVVLDYRDWYAFAVQLIHPGGRTEQLTRKRHSSMSGGEKSAAIHMPLFAAANAIYSSAKADCPRMIALDEAFAGIDGNFMPDLLGLTTKFDLDLFMTGHDLWVSVPTVPMIAHYDVRHDEQSQTVSTMLILWDGEQLIDASAGFAGNEELASELLGFTPTRRIPDSGSVDGMLLVDPGGDPEDGEE
jgi:hypothetical protein